MRTKLVTLLAFAGLLAAAMAVTWGPAAGITNNRVENYTASSSAHKVAFGNDGTGHIVWYDNAGDAVYYKRYNPATGTWSKDLQLAKTAGQGVPAIALDANGKDIHVVWRMWKHVGKTNFHIYYWKCIPSGTGTGGWVGSPTDLCENASGHEHYYPAIACGPNGQVVVTWMEAWGTGANLFRTYGFREFKDGQWQPQQQIEEPIPSYRWNPSIATDANGNVFVAYYGSLTLEGRPGFQVYANQRINGEWLPSWENVTGSLGLPDSFIIPAIEVNPVSGLPHIVCHSYTISVSGTDTARYYHIYHAYRGENGWSMPQMISDPDVPVDCSPSMIFTGDGTAHILWNGCDADHTHNGIKYASCAGDDGEWPEPFWVTTNAYPVTEFSANITAAADGSLHAIWTHYQDGAKYPYQVWGSNSTGTFASGLAADAAGPARGLALDVSPNPVSRGMVVSYSLPAAANVSLRLYDVSGALARTMACGYMLPGNHAVGLSRQGLARGAYILKLESGASSVTRKLVIE